MFLAVVAICIPSRSMMKPSSWVEVSDQSSSTRSARALAVVMTGTGGVTAGGKILGGGLFPPLGLPEEGRSDSLAGGPPHPGMRRENAKMMMKPVDCLMIFIDITSFAFGWLLLSC